MSTSSKYDVEKIVLENIVVQNASIKNTTSEERVKNHATVDVTHTFNGSVNVELMKLRIIFLCTMRNAIGEGEITGNFEIVFDYQVKNLEELSEFNDSAVTLDQNLLAGLFNITYSTCRGIIYTRCLGTAFHNFILPVISTKKMVKNISG